MVIGHINSDLERLLVWGVDNKTAFEPTKTFSMLVSLKRSLRFSGMGGIKMAGSAIKEVSQMKLVGFLFDAKLTWGPMIDRLAKKARSKLGALRRLKPFLDSKNMKLLYTSFVQSGLEYGSLLYMGAAHSHLKKLDKSSSQQRL